MPAVIPAPEVLLRSFPPEKVYGSSLLKVARHFEALEGHVRVAEAAALFEARDDLVALGVVRPDGTTLGLLTRAHLFSLLGKPFGREILSRRPVSEVIEQAVSFDVRVNLFSAAEEVQATMDRASLTYYLLTDGSGQFRGLFSSKDLLSYLSRITQEDLSLAAQLQERLVKGRHSQTGPGWAVEAFSQSAKGLGGDFYHCIPLADGRVFLALGDVSGKGVAASVLTSLLWGVLQFYDYRKGLGRLLTQVNEALIRTFHLEKYLTGIFALYDPTARHLVAADMGHGHGWIVRQCRARQLRVPGPSGGAGMNLPLGIDLELRPQVTGLRLEPGDLLCLYSDGLTEQEDALGNEFGEGRVLRTACHHSGDPRDLPEVLLTRLAAHQGPVPRLDDVTWLHLEVK